VTIVKDATASLLLGSHPTSLVEVRCLQPRSRIAPFYRLECRDEVRRV